METKKKQGNTQLRVMIAGKTIPGVVIFAVLAMGNLFVFMTLPNQNFEVPDGERPAMLPDGKSDKADGQQRKVFHNLLTLPEDFIVRRDTNRGNLMDQNEKVVHEVEPGKRGCMRTWFISITNTHGQRPKDCTFIDVFDKVVLRMYVDGSTEPSVEVPLNKMFGIHHSDAGSREHTENHMYDVSANGAMVLKIPAPFENGLRVTFQSTSNETIYFWSFLDYEEYPGPMHEPLRLQIRPGVSDRSQNQHILARAYEQHGYLLGFTMGVRIAKAELNLVDDLWFHNGGELLVLDYSIPERASLIRGIGGEDIFFETCTPTENKIPRTDLHGFQYALDGSKSPLKHAVQRPEYVSAYRNYLEHNVIPFSSSFDFRVGNTNHYEFSNVAFWYGSRLTPGTPSNLFTDHWTVCGAETFNPDDFENIAKAKQALQQKPMTRHNCEEVRTKGSEFLDLTFSLTKHNKVGNNAKISLGVPNARTSVYATISKERIEATLAGSTFSCIQLQIFHDDVTMVWLEKDLVYFGATRRGHGVSLSLPYHPTADRNVEISMLSTNTENINFRAWSVGIMIKPASCNVGVGYNQTVPLVVTT